jgi:hypothetical protein
MGVYWSGIISDLCVRNCGCVFCMDMKWTTVRKICTAAIFLTNGCLTSIIWINMTLHKILIGVLSLLYRILQPPLLLRLTIFMFLFFSIVLIQNAWWNVLVGSVVLCFLLQRQGWNFQGYYMQNLRQCHEYLTCSVLFVVMTLEWMCRYFCS